MTNYLERYISGEYELVWEQLRALGDIPRQEPSYSDVTKVVRETIRRAKLNVSSIVDKLRANGYIFSYPDADLVLAPVDIVSKLDEMETKRGPLPLVLRYWYEEVSKVYLSGTHPNWPVNAGLFFYRAPGFIHLDPDQEMDILTKPHFNPDAFEITDIFLDSYGEMVYGRTIGVTIAEDDSITAGDAVGTTEIIAPDWGADGRFFSPKHNIAPTFVGYLRKCFAWGGFPGFAEVEESLRPTEMLEYLKEGLLPI